MTPRGRFALKYRCLPDRDRCPFPSSRGPLLLQETRRPARSLPKSGGRAKSRPARRQADAASTSTPEAAKGQQGERIGVLIDADNVSHQHLPTLRRFIGETPISAARAYGDFHGRLRAGARRRRNGRNLNWSTNAATPPARTRRTCASPLMP